LKPHLSEMLHSWIGRVQLTGLALIILCVSLLPYRYLPIEHPVGLFFRFFPLCVVLLLGALMPLGKAALVQLWKTDPFAVPILSVLSVDVLSALGGIQLYQSIGKTTYFFLTGPLIYVLVRWMINEYPHRKVALLWLISSSSALAAAYGISEFWVGGNWLFGAYFDQGNSSYSAMVGQVIFVNRIMGPIGHPVVFAAFLLLTLPVSVFLAQQHRKLKRWLGISASILVASALFLTLSRGAWIGLLAAVLFYCIYRNKRLLGIVFLSLGILGVGISKSEKLSPLVGARISSYGEFVQNFRNNPRVIAYSHVAQILPQRIYLGSGIGTYHLLARPIGSQLNTPDNMYLMRLAETGLIGLMVWVFLFTRIASVLLNYSKIERAHVNRGGDFSILLLAGLVGFSFDMLTFDALYFPVTRIMFWILVGIGCSSISSKGLKCV